MRKKKVQVWVDPEFKKNLKRLAMEEEVGVLELTRRKARNLRDNPWFGL